MDNANPGLETSQPPISQIIPETLASEIAGKLIKEAEKVQAELNARPARSICSTVPLEQNTNNFPQKVYAELPFLLRHAIDQLDLNDKPVYLVTALGVGSACFPNVFGHYAGRSYGANLYVYLLGNYGEGKGAANYARKLAEAIHKAKAEACKILNEDYRREMAIYKKKVKAFEQGKASEMPIEPTRPPILKLYVSVNIAKSGIIQIAFENGGRILIFETESDALTDALKQDHGGFSDVLRRASEHEMISFFRRTNNEDIEINKPCFSVVLSSTFDQLQRLIPSIENGLFSRFLYFEMESNPEFKNVFDKRKNNYNEYFNQVGERYKEIYDYLTALETPLLFELQPHQELRFVEVFKDYKAEALEVVSPLLGGVINRMGVICFRIAMQLATMRAFETGTITDPIICSDQDFENAMLITDCLKKHTLSVFYKLPKPKSINPETGDTEDPEKDRCLELHKLGFNYREIALEVFGVTEKGKPKRLATVHRWITKK